MYASYFGLTEQPFSLAPDPRYLYLSDAHREALAHLVYGISGGGSVLQLTGEVGTGKTTVCRALLEQLPSDVDVAMIFNPRLTSVELLAAVCDELRVAYPAGTTSLKVLVDALSHALLDAHGRGRRTVLIIDEAQNLSAEVLEEVRLLTNLETTRDKLLQVILIGQPELAEILDRPELRQLAQRITARYHLRPFTEEETRAYVLHRMEVAGQRQPIFETPAVRVVHRLSRGVPRLINTICDRALLGAYATARTRVPAAVVRRAAREVLGRAVGRRWWAATAAAASLVAAGSAATWLGLPGLSGGVTQALRGSPGVSTPSPGTARVIMTTAAAPSPTLAEVLAAPSLATDESTAWAKLYALWNRPADANASPLGCEHGQPAGLRCLRRTGTWTVLRRFDLPAILPLVTPGGDKHHVVLAGLEGERATLQIGERRVTLPTAEVERFWDGPFVLVWEPPAVGPVPLRPGMRGKDILWLRQRLAEIEGSAASASGDQVYDEELKQRVMAFQRDESLTPDGIVGEETLLRLTAAPPGSGSPSLSRARR